MYTKSKLSLIGLTILFCLVLLPQNRLTASDHCADLNFDGICDIEDLVLFVNYTFFDNLPDEIELVNIDLDHDNVFDISDLVYLVDYMFRHGPAPVCGYKITDNPSTCLSSNSMFSKSEGLVKSAQTECLPFEVETSSFKIKWYGEFISIEHFGLSAQCCLEFAMFYNITYSGDQAIINVYERDTSATPCYCICDFDVSGLIPFPMSYEPTNYIVNLYDFENDLLITDTVLVGGPGELETEIAGNALKIWYHNAFYNCCPGFYTEYQFDGQNITLTWRDSLGLCDCICYYDLESTIEYLPDGEYIVTLLNNGYGGEGDTVGVDTVVINDTEPYISDGSRSGCLSEKSNNEESFLFDFSENTLTYNHLNAIYNCAFELDFSLKVEGHVLKFYEINTIADPAMCLCPFNITQTVSNIKPGTYLIEVYSQDAFQPEDTLVYKQWHTFD